MSSKISVHLFEMERGGDSMQSLPMLAGRSDLAFLPPPQETHITEDPSQEFNTKTTKEELKVKYMKFIYLNCGLNNNGPSQLFTHLKQLQKESLGTIQHSTGFEPSAPDLNP